MKTRLVIALVISLTFNISTAFAEIPTNAVILGDKAYAVELLFDNSYLAELNAQVQQAVAGGYGLYYKLGDAPYKEIFSGQAVADEVIQNWPQITFVDMYGNETTYAAGNGDEILPQIFKLVNIY